MQALLTRLFTDVLRFAKRGIIASPLPFAIRLVDARHIAIELARFRSEPEALVYWRHLSVAMSAVRCTPISRAELTEHGKLRRVIARGVFASPPLISGT